MDSIEFRGVISDARHATESLRRALARMKNAKINDREENAERNSQVFAALMSELNDVRDLQTAVEMEWT